MFEKEYQGEPLKLVAASIISGFIAVIFFFFCLEFSDAFGLGYIIFTLLALVLGAVAIAKIFKTWKKRKVSAMVELIALLLAGLILFHLTLVSHSTWRTLRTITVNGNIRIMQLGNFINESAKKNGRMPDADHWCDSLVGHPLAGSLRVVKISFNIVGNPDIECNFAFNKNLSNLSIDGLPDNVVMLLEADGELNLSGGPELINTKRAKDKYFWPWKQKFIYVFFIDGTIAKYRLHDDAVALYQPEKEQFTDYFKKGQTPYSPLRWK
jgi:hypothetical protein